MIKRNHADGYIKMEKWPNGLGFDAIFIGPLRQVGLSIFKDGRVMRVNGLGEILARVQVRPMSGLRMAIKALSLPDDAWDDAWDDFEGGEE